MGEINDMTGGDMADSFVERLLLLDDSLACVAMIHLCVEYWTDRIIKEKCSGAATYLGDPRMHGLGIKLAALWNNDILPEGLCRNIKLLQRLKARCVEDMDVDFSQMDLGYEDPEGNMKLDQFRDRLVSGDEETAKAVLRWIGMFTFGWLSKHCVEELGMVR
ncbi:MAG: hypothetical protein GXP25_06295 [Planctomycetes bacterium]|nr:hypothetical protein [Planctomycetota bacterium]